MPKLNRDGINLYYEVHGDAGPVILLTHGYSATSQMWQGQIAPLAKKHKLVIWDMRGHGQTDYPAEQSEYSEEKTVADMAALLDTVGAKKAIVGGLSLGGYMSLAFNATHPDRVQALLIIDTGPGYKKDDAREGWNANAIKTAERYERDGLGQLSAASAERRTAHHRDATGLSRAGRGMLTQKNARVINSLPSQIIVVVAKRTRPSLPLPTTWPPRFLVPRRPSSPMLATLRTSTTPPRSMRPSKHS